VSDGMASGGRDVGAAARAPFALGVAPAVTWLGLTCIGGRSPSTRWIPRAARVSRGQLESHPGGRGVGSTIKSPVATARGRGPR
jgi:hypothetical protein